MPAHVTIRVRMSQISWLMTVAHQSTEDTATATDAATEPVTTFSTVFFKGAPSARRARAEPAHWDRELKTRSAGGTREKRA
jgi:hypothetical protein